MKNTIISMEASAYKLIVRLGSKLLGMVDHATRSVKIMITRLNRIRIVLRAA